MYIHAARDPQRTAERLSLPWKIQPIDNIVSEIISGDGTLIVGHLCNDCVRHAQNLFHPRSKISTEWHGDQMFFSASIGSADELDRSIALLTSYRPMFVK